MRNFEDIKKEVAEGKAKPRPDFAPNSLTLEQEEEFIKTGDLIDKLMNTEGWKKINQWILDRLNISNILYFRPEELVIYQQNVKAYTDLFNYMNGSVKLRDSIIKERSQKDGE